MRIPKEGKLLRIFVGEAKKWQGKPLHEQIVLLARREGLAGATVMKGIMGYGASKHIHMAKLLELSDDLPVVIEIVDSKENISTFLPHLDAMIPQGLVTLEDVHVILYRASK